MFASRSTSLVRRTILASLLMVAAAGSVYGQGISSGARVRIVTKSGTTTLVVDSIWTDRLTGRDPSGSILRVPFDTATVVYVSRGPRDRVSTATKYGGIGMVAGGVLGLVLGLTSSSDDDDPYTDTFDDLFEESVDDAVTIGSVIAGAGLGLVAGGAIGLMAPGERWERVPLNGTRIGVSGDGGLSLAYTIRF